ncbi:helix-turn-helix transcriptional regulator [Brevundimonas diminuta]|uniref:helix-turn-helix transcriptional regulator n=1 Tax=Brevundimonas diminuta TaxID=293 RepID=UPI0022AF5240|nr:helix-turn-helix transcriptional regulator [Brevundimonas diminuta]MCZ4109556.1 helix-turn-helix transcriptional regulator [Brevundimonas diminuta]
MTSVGSTLRNARKRLELSQEELARRVGLKSKGHLSDIERDKDVPSLRVALALERETGVPAETLSPDVALARAPVILSDPTERV